MLKSALNIAFALMTLTCSASGQSADPLTPIEIEADASVSAVTLYIGRASVTRTWIGPLEVGVYDLKFTDLPASADHSRLQARTIGGAKVLGVEYSEEYVEFPPSDQNLAFAEMIKAAEREIEDLDRQAGLLTAREIFVNSVAVRATREAEQKGGTPDLDLDVVRQQLAFVSEERETISMQRQELAQLHEDRQEALDVLREKADRLGAQTDGLEWRNEATVSLAVTDPGAVEVSLIYLVDDAAWAPAYNIRKPMGAGKITVEYDALIAQSTGEDWINAALTLSTAEPKVSANPPSLSPWYVDVASADKAELEASRSRPAPSPGDGGFGSGGGGSIYGDAGDDPDRDAVAALAQAARVSSGGTSITYTLPRTVTVPSDIEQRQRTRIASFDITSQYRHVATPVMTDAVYVRGDLANNSAYQLLPGEASIFVGPDYVGPTWLNAVAPGGEFELHFGIDRSVSVKRTLVRKHTEKTGMFNGGRGTHYDYRIEIENSSARAITLELWDRHPVSRSDDIEITMVNIAPALATDAQYVKEEMPQGLMKWLINIPSKRTGANAVVVTWSMRISRGKDTEMTALPE